MEEPKKPSPKSLANLRPPWRKGEVANPRGINRKRPITDRYWEVSERLMPDAAIRQANKRCGFRLFVPGITWAEGIALRAAYEAVCRGLVRPMREMREAIEGKAPQRLEITGPERKEVTIRVVHDRPGHTVERLLTRDEWEKQERAKVQ